MQVWNMLHAAHWKYRTQSRHLGTIAQIFLVISSQLRHVSTIGRKLVLKQQYLLHMSSQYGKLGPLAAEICGRVWGTPANFNGFLILALLLQWRRSTEANETLHDVWPSPGLGHYIYTFGGSCYITEFCQVQNSLCVQVLRCPILAALLHGTRVVDVSQTLRRWAEGATYIRQGGRAAITLGIGPHF